MCARANRSTSSFCVPYTTTITAGPEEVVNDGDVHFEFSSSPAGASFQCSLDGAGFTSCASPVNYTGLADGPHTFDVRATVTGSSVAHWAFAVDTTPPVVTIVSFAEERRHLNEAFMDLTHGGIE